MNRYIHEKLYNMIYLESPMRSYQWETFEKDLEDMQTRPNANHVDLTRSVIVTNRPAFSESLYEVKINGHSVLQLFWIPWAKLPNGYHEKTEILENQQHDEALCNL